MGNGWPDPSRPGVPLNPERTGPHQLRDASGLTHLLLWKAPWWIAGWGHITRKPEEAANVFSYVGPCLTPAEVATLVAEARREEREACAVIADEYAKPNDINAWGTHEEILRAEGRENGAWEIANDIRARGAA